MLLDRPFFSRLFHLGLLAARGMTLGVRGAAIDGEGRVCLVRHTYVSGWHLPGGGVEIGEEAATAMIREFAEEARVAVDPGVPMRLHGLYRNTAGPGRDHVALYVVPAFAVLGAKAPDREIAEAGFFSLDGLPEGTTRATRARLAEIRDGGPPAETW